MQTIDRIAALKSNGLAAPRLWPAGPPEEADASEKRKPLLQRALARIGPAVRRLLSPAASCPRCGGYNGDTITAAQAEGCVPLNTLSYSCRCGESWRGFLDAPA